ncbi:MAG: hypothetical protein ABIK18_01970, partial [candidate division WOR-3 bacterium]
VCFDGTNYLVVWYDNRNNGYDIWGARVTPEGVLLDSAGIPISTAPDTQWFPAVCFDGTNYLVVWNTGDIYGARVAPDGVVLDTQGIPISTAPREQVGPAVCFDGTNYLVVWQDKRGGNYEDIYGARVTPDGVVLDTQGIPISTAPYYQGYPAVSFDGTNYFVVWQDTRNGNRDIYGARVAPDGVVLDTAGIAISTASGSQDSPSVAFDGTNYLVVWEDWRNSGGPDIYGARVAPDGVVFDTAGIAISTASGNQGSPSVAFDGTNYFVVWQDTRNGNRDIYGARVAPDGVVLDTAGITISTVPQDKWFPAVCSDGTIYLVVWDDQRNTRQYPEIYGARVAPDGVVFDTAGFIVSTAVNQEKYPAVCSDGTDYLMVWEDNRRKEWDIYGARVTSEGVVLDPAGFAISTAGNSQTSPALSFDGTNYLVAWQDTRNGNWDIYGARVTPDGIVLDTAGFGISITRYWETSPAISFDGTNYLVVWISGDIYGARVTPDGVVLDTQGIPISTGPYYQDFPAVAFDGTNYLVVWSDQRNLDNYDIYGARVTPDGVVLDTQGIFLFTAGNDQTYPKVAFDGTNYLVVWQDNWWGNWNITAARVTKEGYVLDTFSICVAPGEQSSPAVLFDGTNYIVMWQDNRSGSFDIWGARVSPQGVILDKGPVVVQEGDQQYPALAQGQGSQRLLVYQGWTGKVDGKTYNTYRIWGKLNPNVGVEERSQPTAKGSRLNATIVRNVLKLGTEDGRRKTEDGHRSSVLLDISGRKVFELNPGENNIRHLAPGVYFIRSEASIERKIVITK